MKTLKNLKKHENMKKNSLIEALRRIFFVLLMVTLTLFSIGFVSSATWTESFNENLIEYWTFDNDTNGEMGISNCTGVGNTRSDTGGLINGFVNFTGGADGTSYLNCSDAKAVGSGVSQFANVTDQFTLAWWVNPNPAPSTGFMVVMTDQFPQGSSNDFVSRTNLNADNTVLGSVITGAESECASCGSWSNSGWHQMVWTYNGINNTFYIDGVRTGGQADTGNFLFNSDPVLMIGAGAAINPNSPMEGSIDEVAVYNRSFNTSDVVAHYNSGAGLTFIPPPSPPSITLNTPEAENSTLSETITFNCSATDNNQVKNITLFIDGVSNTTVSGSSSSLSLEKTLNLSVAKHTWGCNATDNGNEISSDVRNLTVGFIEHNQNYTNSVRENTIQQFSLNMSYNSTKYENIAVSLFYNNTEYSGAVNYGSGNNGIFNKSLTVPSISTKTNFTLYWEITLNDGSNDFKLNSSFQNQTISAVGVDNCSSFTNTLYNITIFDEQNLALLNGTQQNTTARLNVQLLPLGRSLEVTAYNFTFSKVNPFQICLDSDLSGGEEYSLDMQIQYLADDYATEFYHVINDTISDSDLGTNLSLYGLKNSSSTEFKISYKDARFIEVKDAVIQIQRKYIGENLFRIVEAPKTDNDGIALGHLQAEDTVYTFVVVKNGQVLDTFSNFIATCESQILGTCEINLRSTASQFSTRDYTVLDDFTFTLTYDNDTRKVQSIFSIPSNTASEVLLNVTLYDNIGGNETCSHKLTASSGTLSCTVPNSFGNASVVAKIFKDGTEMGRGFISLAQKPRELYGSNLVFLGLFLFLTLVGVGVGNSPMVSGIFLIIGSIFAFAINIVGGTGFIGVGATSLWFIVAVVIVLIKLRKTE